MREFQPFEMERLMSVWEQKVDYNLSESGVHPLSLRELLGEDGNIASLLDTGLGYPQVEGTDRLRERVAALHGGQAAGAGPENVLVTVGCCEALLVTLQTLAAEGDGVEGGEIAMMLPGLRLGWLVAPEEMRDAVWRRHEYATLACTALYNRLAEIVLSPDVRPRIIARTREIVRRGYVRLESWLAGLNGLFEVVAPQAAAIAFVRHHLDMTSLELVERLIRDQGVLVVPGEHFGVERHVRISFGPPADYLAGGLARVEDLLRNL